MDCGCTVAQRGTFTTSEHRRHPPPLIAKSLMTHRINPAVEPMKPAALRPLGDRALRQSHLNELRGRDDPMLLTRDQRDPQIH